MMSRRSRTRSILQDAVTPPSFSKRKTPMAHPSSQPNIPFGEPPTRPRFASGRVAPTCTSAIAPRLQSPSLRLSEGIREQGPFHGSGLYASRQTRLGVTHVLELRLVTGKRGARLGVNKWRQLSPEN